MGKNKSDHILAVVKAGISGIPIVGGSIASLISDYVPSSTQKIIENAIDDLAVKITQLSNRIDVENINKEDFAELFKSTYLIIIRSHKQKRINAAVNLLTNILLNDDDPEKLSYNELDHFSKVLDQLSIGALEVLGSLQKFIETKYNEKLNGNSDTEFIEKRILTFRDILITLPENHPSLLMGLVNELSSFNLIYIVIPQVRVTNYENYTIELTVLGVRFIQYVLNNSA